MTRHTAYEAALSIIEELRRAGYVALLAGGCVRDRLLGLEPKDYDVATNATPQQVACVFPKARHVGAKFGVMIVRRFRRDTEVATFRSDVSYSNGRHPDEVVFGTDKEDAGRRDFTVNGLFYDPLADRVIDYVGGQADIAARILRTIGNPRARFAEDHLRMLRAVRFAARFGFEIEKTTFMAIVEHAVHLEAISPERVWMELGLILTAPTRAEGWRLITETGLRKHLCPGWPDDGQEDLRAQSRLSLIAGESITPSLAMATVLCERTPQKAEEVCRALRLSGRLSKAVTWLVRSLPLVHSEADLELADLKILMADTHWPELVELLRVDLQARGDGQQAHQRVCDRAATIPHEKVAPAPLLNGDDLCALGIGPGPQLGELLTRVYRLQLNERISTRRQAVEFIRKETGTLPT